MTSRSCSESHDPVLNTGRPSSEGQEQTSPAYVAECEDSHKAHLQARMKVVADYERRLSPLPAASSDAILKICNGWGTRKHRAPEPTLHYGFLLTHPDMAEIVKKLLQAGRLEPEAKRILPFLDLVIIRYLNHAMEAVVDENSERVWVMFEPQETVSMDENTAVFSLYTTTIRDDWEIPGYKDEFKLPREPGLGAAVKIFQELAPQREPAWYFDRDTYYPSIFKFKAFKARRVVGSALARLLCADVR